VPGLALLRNVLEHGYTAPPHANIRVTLMRRWSSISKFWYWLSGTKAPTKPIAETTRDTVIFARARVGRIAIEERYSVRQTVSRNPDIGQLGTSTGSIEILMPYDGDECFTREAADDVEFQLRSRVGEPSVAALIGHLVVAEHQDTNLADVLQLDGRFGAMPLRVPVRTVGVETRSALIADEREHRLAVKYAPSADIPRLLPISLSVDLADPDHIDLTESSRSLTRTLTSWSKSRTTSNGMLGSSRNCDCR